MKTLFILHGWPPESIGGTEIYARRLAKRLSGEIEMRVFCREIDSSRPEYDLRTIADGGIEVTKVNYDPAGAADFTATYRNENMAGAFQLYLEKTGNPDIAHVHHLGGLGHDVIDVLRKRNIPIAITFHDFAFTCPRGQRLRGDIAICKKLYVGECVDCLKPQCKGKNIGATGKLIKYLFRKSEGRRLMEDFWKSSERVADAAETIIAPSEHHARMLRQDGFDASKIRAMPYGYDIDTFNKKRGEIGLARKFGYLGSLIPSKGVHLIVEAFRRLKKEYSDLPIELHVHGPAPAYHGKCEYETMLRQKSRGLNVKFHGAFNPEKILDILLSLDAVIVPSLWWESHGMVVREAKLAGLAVIVSSHGALAEPIKDGVNGLLFRPGDARSLRDKIYILASTPGLADAIANGPMDIISIEDDAQKHLKLYEEILSKTGKH